MLNIFKYLSASAYFRAWYIEKRLNQGADYSFRNLAKRIGISPSYVHRLMAGKKPVSPLMIPALIKLLEIGKDCKKPEAMKKYFYLMAYVHASKMPDDIKMEIIDKYRKMHAEE